MTARLPAGCAQLLAFQHGIIARWQATAAGLDTEAIDRQLRYGRWQALYHGVYATFTGVPTRDCLLWAGVLRAGPGALLSHHTAAELDGLTDQPSVATHVTVGRQQRVRIADEQRHALAPHIVVHRTGRLDVARHPVRTPPRTRTEETILDLTQLSPNFDDAFSWLCKGCGRRLVTPDVLRKAVAARSRVRWRRQILGALSLIADGVHSPLEYRYLRDVEGAHGLPRAKRQARMSQAPLPRSRYLDNLYPAFGVVVELDGRAHHRVEDRWRDIHRDNANARAGLMTLRFNWADVTCRPCEVAADVASALRQRGWDGLPRCCGPSCTVRF